MATRLTKNTVAEEPSCKSLDLHEGVSKGEAATDRGPCFETRHSASAVTLLSMRLGETVANAGRGTTSPRA